MTTSLMCQHDKHARILKSHGKLFLDLALKLAVWIISQGFKVENIIWRRISQAEPKEKILIKLGQYIYIYIYVHIPVHNSMSNVFLVSVNHLRKPLIEQEPSLYDTISILNTAPMARICLQNYMLSMNNMFWTASIHFVCIIVLMRVAQGTLIRIYACRFLHVYRLPNGYAPGAISSGSKAPLPPCQMPG